MALMGSVSLTHADVSFGFKPDGTLDEKIIRTKYFEGDFRRIQAPLEAWRTSLAKKTREDSIFIYKYLSVIYRCGHIRSQACSHHPRGHGHSQACSFLA